MQGVSWDGARRPSWAPLALTLALHLLLVLAWLAAGRPPTRPPSRPPAGQRTSELVLVAPIAAPAQPVQPMQPMQPMQAVAPQPPQATQPRASLSRPSSSAQRGARDAAEGAPPPRQLQPALAEALRDETPATQVTASDTASDTALPAAPSSAPTSPRTSGLTSAPPSASSVTGLPGDLLASSKRLAGPIDRELRQGGSPITAEPDRKWARFADAVAGARTSNSNGVTLASYTAPDGIVIYRKTVGSRVLCYRGGSVGGVGIGPFAPGDGRGAGNIPCPSGANWRRL